jgi:hypothetical protein
VSGLAEGHPPGEVAGFAAGAGAALELPVPLFEPEESGSGLTLFTSEPESSLTAGLRRCVCVVAGRSGSTLLLESDSSGTCVRVTDVVPELWLALLAMYTWR